MSTTTLIQGIRITLAESQAEDTSIGLYTSGSVSQIRLSEAELTGASQTYKNGVLSRGGIPAIDDGGSFERGGDFVFAQQITVLINNTSQFYKKLDDASIGINALPCEIIEFEISVSTGLVLSETVLFYGKTNIREWNVANYSLPIEPPIYNRKAFLGKIIDSGAYPNAADSDIGKMIPATYGEFSGARYAKMVRTKSIRDVYTLENLVAMINDTVPAFLSEISDQTIKGRTQFPIISKGSEPTLVFDVKLSVSGLFIGNFTTIANPVSSELFVNVTLGDNAVGENKRIASFAYVDYYTVRLTLAEYFTTEPVVSATGDEGWLQFVKYSKEFAADAQPCKEWLDSSGTSIGSAAGVSPELYSYESQNIVPVSGDEEVAIVQPTPIQYYRIPSGFVTSPDANVNKIALLSKYLQGQTLDEIYCHLSKPAENVALLNESPENFDVDHFSGTLQKVTDGLYKYVDGGSYHPFTDCTVTKGTLAEATDRDESTLCSIILTDTTYNKKASWAKYFLGFTFDLPPIPDNFSFDSVCLAIRADTKVRPRAFNLQTDADVMCVIASRRFLGGKIDILEHTSYGSKYWDVDNEDSISGRVDTLPDNYFTSPRNENEKYYYVFPVLVSTPKGNRYVLLRNRTIFPLNTSGASDEYRTIDKCAFMLYRSMPNGGLTNPNPGNFVDYIRIYEIGVLFEKRMTLGSELYTLMRGRIYGATWGGRRTAADCILDSVDQYEDICRRQNWAETGDVTTIFGEEQSPNALINVARWDIDYTGLTSGPFQDGEPVTSTSGGSGVVHYDDGVDFMSIHTATGDFAELDIITGTISGASATISGTPSAAEGGLESPRLDDARSRRFAFQLTRENKSWTDVQKKSFCKALWCIGSINERGEECLSYIPQTDTAITDTITLADVPRGMQIGNVVEPKPENVFCEPFVRYKWDEGSQRFCGWIGIKNVHIGTWQQAYTPGLTGSEGQAYYNWCHDNLWTRYHQIEQPPSDMTDRYEITTDEDAKWWLTNWLDVMLVRRLPHPVRYPTARLWRPGRHIYIQLPHQTNNVAQEAVIERIEKNKNKGFCMLHLAYWVEQPVQYYIQEVMYTKAQGADADWVETMNVVGDSTDKIEGM